MVWGSVIAGGAGLAGGLLGGKSQKDAFRHSAKRVKKYTREAQDIYGQYTPEMLEIYRGLLPELGELWSGQRERVSDMYRGRYQEASDASTKRAGDVKQQLQRKGLGATTNTEAFNRAQRAQDMRDAMMIDAAKAGTFQQLAAAEAASKSQGRAMAGAGIQSIAQGSASFPMRIADFFASSVGRPPAMSPDGQSLGALGQGIGGMLGSIFGGIGGQQDASFGNTYVARDIAPTTTQFMGNVGLQALSGLW